MAQCPYRVRDFDNMECHRTNCTMTAFEVVNAAALYHGEITLSTTRRAFTNQLVELCDCPDCDPADDETKDWTEPHPERFQDRCWTSRLINGFWSLIS